MIAADDEDGNTRIRQAAHLRTEEDHALHASEIAIEEIPSNHQGVDLLFETKRHRLFKGLPGRIADKLRDLRIPESQGTQRRVQMDVGGMKKAKRHGLFAVVRAL